MRAEACLLRETVTRLAERRLGLQALMASTEAELRKIDAALGRLSSGQYGTCAACGYPIEPPRLRAVPYIECCAGCA